FVRANGAVLRGCLRAGARRKNVTIYFYEPPAEKQIGGLAAAIQNLRATLEKAGVAVVSNAGLPAAGGDAVVHFHALWNPAHAKLSKQCAARGLSFIVSPHGMLEPWAWRHKWWKKWPYFLLVERRHLARATCLLATSENEAEQLRRFYPKKKISVVPLGLTGTAKPDYNKARGQLGWKDDECVLLFLSRIHPKKGLDILLHALFSLGMDLPPKTRLAIVGGGDPAYVKTLQNYCANSAAALPQIDWIGEVWGEERWKFFQGADLFCLPTHSENFGLAILESCQVGTPALTTRATPWARDLEN